ncbi:hypothetical protein KPH14_008252 [Odynerus spinipes]|uniref:Uncharacterized protein n=1 Tax=Odynerus spinipes TaxID=1348599 RepID=A0AAD9RGK3_9HYME|nr:hypothetical protein KPH14_008252 [Odynerus spinipes]
METVRPCGCKGIRTCLTCEAQFNIVKPDLKQKLQEKPSYIYCPHCDKAWPGWDIELYKQHPHHIGDAIDYPGVFIELDFLSTEETTTLIKSLDKLPWEPSQSGRRKQNFGPKCNFKKRKLRMGTFNGFPQTTEFVQKKLSEVPILNKFRTVEQCTLEYNPERGASIDPHIDDCWIWGERVVTVNVLGNSALTMTPYIGPITRYNLDYVENYSSDVSNKIEMKEDIVVRLPLPAKSLMVLYGPARYSWEHSILREDVTRRRVCLAYRELTPPYLENGLHEKEASEILEKATMFWIT